VLTTLLYSPISPPPNLVKEIKTPASVEQKPVAKSSWIKSPLGKTPDLELTGIVTMDNEKIALINGQMVKRGEYIEGAYVINILNDKVYLDLGGKPVVLKIK
jgi:molybdenum cofactor biosynthesis enzyme